MSAVLHPHDHAHDDHHDHHGHGEDLNMKAAYIHVLADAATSVLAIIALHSLVEYPLWYGPFQMAVGWCVWMLWPRSTHAPWPRPRH